VDPTELEGKVRAYGDGGRSLPGREALSEHDADQGMVVVDVGVILAPRENDAILVLRREVVAFQEEEGVVSRADVLSDRLGAFGILEDALVDQGADRPSSRRDALTRVVDVTHVSALARPGVVYCALELGTIEQQAHAPMQVTVLLPHARPRPAAVKAGVFGVALGVTGEAEYPHAITSGPQFRVDGLDGAIRVARTAVPTDAWQDVLVLNWISHEPVGAQPQPVHRQDVLEGRGSCRVVGQQPFRFCEGVGGQSGFSGRRGHSRLPEAWQPCRTQGYSPGRHCPKSSGGHSFPGSRSCEAGVDSARMAGSRLLSRLACT